MLKKIFTIVQMFIKIALACLLIFSSYDYLNNVFYKKDISHGEEYRSLPDNCLDVLVLGSSDSQYSFIPGFFFKDTGLRSYVRGSACQPLEVSYEMLKDSLKTQKPKMVILEVFTAMPLRRTCEEDGCYVIAEYQMSGREKINTINYLPEEKAKEYRNDFFNYHNDWKTMENFADCLSIGMRNTSDIVFYDFGYIMHFRDEGYPANWWYPNIYNDLLDVELDELDLESLNNIYDLCQKENIELLLYKTPIDGIEPEDYSYLFKVWEWAEEREVRYVDFVTKATSLNFCMQIHSDAFHAYTPGAAIITNYLSDYVTKNYSLETSESDVDREYLRSSDGLVGYAIESEDNPMQYLQTLRNVQGIVVVDYHKAPYEIPQYLYECMKGLGIDGFDGSSDYFAVLNDGELIAEDNHSINIDVNGINISVDAENCYVDGEYVKVCSPFAITYVPKNRTFPVVTKNVGYASDIVEVGGVAYW